MSLKKHQLLLYWKNDLNKEIRNMSKTIDKTYIRKHRGQYECVKCSDKFKASSISWHLINKHRMSRFKCSVCFYRSMFKSKVAQHIENHREIDKATVLEKIAFQNKITGNDILRKSSTEAKGSNGVDTEYYTKNKIHVADKRNIGNETFKNENVTDENIVKIETMLESNDTCDTTKHLNYVADDNSGSTNTLGKVSKVSENSNRGLELQKLLALGIVLISEGGYTCQYCMKCFEYMRPFYHHLEGYHKMTRFECSACGYKAFRKDCVVRHFKRRSCTCSAKSSHILTHYKVNGGRGNSDKKETDLNEKEKVDLVVTEDLFESSLREERFRKSGCIEKEEPINTKYDCLAVKDITKSSVDCYNEEDEKVCCRLRTVTCNNFYSKKKNHLQCFHKNRKYISRKKLPMPHSSYVSIRNQNVFCDGEQRDKNRETNKKQNNTILKSKISFVDVEIKKTGKMGNEKDEKNSNSGKAKMLSFHTKYFDGTDLIRMLNIDSMKSDRGYSCNYCNKSYSNRKSIFRHLSVRHHVKAFECSICGYQNCRKERTLKHLTKVHSKNNQCMGIIGNTIGTSQKREHMNENVIQMNINENKNHVEDEVEILEKLHGIADKTDIAVAMNKNNSQKDDTDIAEGVNHSGTVCPTNDENNDNSTCSNSSCVDRAQNFIKNINKDKMVKTRIGYCCGYCKKRIKNKSNMYQHLSFKHDKKSFECSICGYQHYSRICVIKHLIKLHNNHIITSVNTKTRASRQRRCKGDDETLPLHTNITTCAKVENAVICIEDESEVICRDDKDEVNCIDENEVATSTGLKQDIFRRNDDGNMKETESVCIKEVAGITNKTEVICIEDEKEVLCNEDVVETDEKFEVICIDDEQEVICIDDEKEVICIDDEQEIICIDDEQETICIDDEKENVVICSENETVGLCHSEPICIKEEHKDAEIVDQNASVGFYVNKEVECGINQDRTLCLEDEINSLNEKICVEENKVIANIKTTNQGFKQHEDDDDDETKLQNKDKNGKSYDCCKARKRKRQHQKIDKNGPITPKGGDKVCKNNFGYIKSTDAERTTLFKFEKTEKHKRGEVKLEGKICRVDVDGAKGKSSKLGDIAVYIVENSKGDIATVFEKETNSENGGFGTSTSLVKINCNIETGFDDELNVVKKGNGELNELDDSKTYRDGKGRLCSKVKRSKKAIKGIEENLDVQGTDMTEKDKDSQKEMADSSSDMLQVKKLTRKGKVYSTGSVQYGCGWCKFRAVHSMTVVKHHYRRHQWKELDIVRLKKTCAPCLGLDTSIGFSCDDCDFSGRFRHELHLHNDKNHLNSLNRDGVTDCDSDNASSPVYPYFYYNANRPPYPGTVQKKYNLKRAKIICVDVFKYGMEYLVETMDRYDVSKLNVDSLPKDDFVAMAAEYKDDVFYNDSTVKNYVPKELEGLKAKDIDALIR